MARTERQLADAAEPPTRVPEVVDTAVIDVAGVPVAVQAAVAPTQMRYPWKSTLRTVFQALVALATLIPLVVTGVYDDGDNLPAVVAQLLVVCGLVSRVMAMPAVEEFLRRFVPFLAAAAKPDDHVIDPPSRELTNRVLTLEAGRLQRESPPVAPVAPRPPLDPGAYRPH